MAYSSGTVALHISLVLAGVKPRDLVLVPTRTCIATVNAINYCGAGPVFFDCKDHYSVDQGQVASCLRHNGTKKDGELVHGRSGKQIAAILPVRALGNATQVKALRDVVEEFALPVGEDAAQSLGARYVAKSGRRTGGEHAGAVLGDRRAKVRSEDVTLLRNNPGHPSELRSVK